MPDVLQVLILSGHMTREHDNEHRSFRVHNQWITTLLEDTGRFRVRVVEDPRGLPADIIDKYDVVIVVFEGRDGYHEKGVGFGAETDAALLRFVHDEGKGIVWFHGSAVQEDDWGYPEEYNVLRGAKLSVATGIRPRPWGEALLSIAEPGHAITDGIAKPWTVTGDDILVGRGDVRRGSGAADDLRRPRVVREGARMAHVALPGPDSGRGARRHARDEHRPADRLDQRVRRRPLVHDHDRPRHRHVPSHRVHPDVPARRRVGGDGRGDPGGARIVAESADSSPGRTTTTRAERGPAPPVVERAKRDETPAGFGCRPGGSRVRMSEPLGTIDP